MFSANAQSVLINEYSPDAGNWDSKGGEWFELRNTTASDMDISCWRFTNGGNMKLTFPSGTVIPANGILLVASQSKTLCATCDFPDLNTQFPNPVSGVTGLYSGINNYVNARWLNLDACGCWNGIGALNNQPLGDRAVLFDADLNIIDATQFAGGTNYGALAITVNTPAVGTCGVRSVTIPAVNDPVYNQVCNDLTGCNSSYARNTNSTWYIAGNIIEDDLDNCGGTSGAGNARGVDHPTPGLVNTVPVFDFGLTGSVSGNIVSTTTIDATQNPNVNITTPIATLNYCTSENLTFTYNVFNYQNVQESYTYIDASKTKIGSFYTVNGTASAFSTVSTNAFGTTTLTQTVTPPLGTTTYEFVWSDQNTDNCTCPGGLSINTPKNFSSTAQECYVYRKVVVNRFQPLATVSLTCNSTTGVSTATVTPTDNIGTVTYTLKDNLGNIITSNNTGVFQYNLLPPNPPYTIEATNICGTVVSAPAPICSATPPCPQITSESINNLTTGTVTICPGDNLSLFATGTDLPSGAQIEWYYNISTPFDPYIGQGTLFGTGTFANATTVTCPQIVGVMVDAPNKLLTDPLNNTCNTAGAEGQNEYLILKTGNSPLAKSDITLQHNGTNVFSGTQDITNTTSGTNAISKLNQMIGSCASGNVFVPAPNIIPADSKVIMIFANINYQYDFSPLCGQTIYVLVSSLNPGAGFFSNSNTAKTLSLNIASCSSCNTTATYTPPSGTRHGYNVTFGNQTTSTIAGTNNNPTTAQSICGATPDRSFESQALVNNPTPTFSSTCVPPTSNVTAPFPATCSSTAQTFYVKGVIKPEQNSGTTCLGTLVQTTATRQVNVNPCPVFTITANDVCIPSATNINISSNINLPANYQVFISKNGVQVSGSPFTLGALTAGTPVLVTNAITQSGSYDIVVQRPLGSTTNCDATVNTPLIINRFLEPTITGAPSAQTICAGESYDLSNFESLFTIDGIGTTEWYDALSGGTLISPKLVAPTSTTTYYLQAKSDLPAGCISPSRSQVVVNVVPIPSPTSVTCTGATSADEEVTITSTCTTCNQEFSLDGVNWQASNIFTADSAGTSGWGTTNTTVYVRNADALPSPVCVQSFVASTNVCAEALPIKLGDFWGYRNNTTNVLKWFTLHEMNVNRFEIERSNDGEHFKYVGTVQANGNSSTRKNYSLVDNNPINGNNYYRLKSIDNDGSVEYSKTILLRNAKKPISINSVSPNPAYNSIEVSISNEMNESFFVEISDVSGKVVLSKLFDESKTQKAVLDISALAKGIYMLNIKSGNEVIDNVKFVKAY